MRRFSYHIMWIVYLLCLLPAVFAQVDIYQHTHYAVNATTSVDPGPRGLGGLITSINTTLIDRPQLFTSGTWFEEADVIVIDSLVLQSGSPVSGLNCTISLKDSTLTQIVTTAQMPQNTIAGVPHYTFNRTNVSVLGGALQGKFFGHVQCIKTPPQPFTVYSTADFEVHAIRGPILAAITDFRSTLERLLERQFDFSQEEVFLITDAFNSMSRLLDAVEGGDISSADAAVQFTSTKQMLDARLGSLMNSAVQGVAPRSGVQGFISSVTAYPRVVSNYLLKGFLYKAILFLLLANVALVLWRKKKADEF